ncbi:DNA-3-methyladenine glycosylase I [Luteithermobacter gelatinilyticus]|uniref:DNA-3-methyladenine glycosylase I n=1 Tax=Luteithermobacter gelatinilyticus TaxID=2582913 RepID=UPI001FEA5ADF|nr:DNA-3-methyladenine glycosylase I [Luteithermobacter gelatinilyticus]
MTTIHRCCWPGEDPLYCAYHDEEWGVPVYESRALFEKLILDGFQAGLSWITILRRRDHFIRAFDGFDPRIIAAYDEKDIERLMQDPGIIRNRQKIMATIKNARAYLAIEEKQEGGFADLLWSFTDGKPRQNEWREDHQIPAETAESRAMSKALKERGFGFCGPTICYAFMQAVGMVNDHVTDCFRYEEIRRLSSGTR